MHLTTLDTIVLVVCGIAAIRGLLKGFAWQAVRTVGAVAAFLLAGLWHARVGTWLRDSVGFLPDEATPWVAWVLLFVAFLFVTTYLAWIVRGALRRARLGPLDRASGLVLGAGLGLVLVTAALLVWGRISSPQRLGDALEGSVTRPYMAKVVDVFEVLIPADVREAWRDVLDVPGAD